MHITAVAWPLLPKKQSCSIGMIKSYERKHIPQKRLPTQRLKMIRGTCSNCKQRRPVVGDVKSCRRAEPPRFVRRGYRRGILTQQRLDTTREKRRGWYTNLKNLTAQEYLTKREKEDTIYSSQNKKRFTPTGSLLYSLKESSYQLLLLETICPQYTLNIGGSQSEGSGCLITNLQALLP